VYHGYGGKVDVFPTIDAGELFDFLFCNPTGKENLAMVFHAFIDDSADRNREKAVISGAIIGRRETWNTLNKLWKERLAKDSLEYFKSSHCRTRNGQFHKFRAFPDGAERALQVQRDLGVCPRISLRCAEFA
jgi:hypothetical protein